MFRSKVLVSLGVQNTLSEGTCVPVISASFSCFSGGVLMKLNGCDMDSRVCAFLAGGTPLSHCRVFEFSHVETAVSVPVYADLFFCIPS